MILIISGFDGTASAGFLLDSFIARIFGAPHYCMVPALTAQNHREVIGVQVCNLHNQILGLTEEPSHIKIGLLYNADMIKRVSEFLQRFPGAKIICDTPIVSSSGHGLVSNQIAYISAFEQFLLPVIHLLTPNTDEIFYFGSVSDVLQSGCKNILLKGGNKSGDYAVDILYSKTSVQEFSLPKINFEETNIRGTGCALSTAIACYMWKGLALEEAIPRAKKFVHNGILHSKRVDDKTRVMHWPNLRID